MKTKYLVLALLSPLLLLGIILIGPLYVLHRLIDQRTYEA